MKIFCIGLNKTGTMSLDAAFKMLGVRSFHNWRRCSEIADYALKGRRHPLPERAQSMTLDGFS